MVNSKDKGRTYEYKVRDLLTDALKIKFERVPLSGALPYLKGDIFTLDGFEYCIECKHYADLNFNSLLTARSNDIHSFWDQAKKAAITMKKDPLLVFRWNRSKDFVAWDSPLMCDSYMRVTAFNNDFKLALFSDWLNAYLKSKS